MPKLLPSHGPVQGTAEHRVWEQLCEELPENAYLLSNVRIANDYESRESDLIVVWPGVGITLIEIKGGHISHSEGEIFSSDGREKHKIDPVSQVTSLRKVVDKHVKPRWGLGYSPKMSWLVVFPDRTMPVGDDLPGMSRKSYLDKGQLPGLKDAIRASADVQSSRYSVSECERFVNAVLCDIDSQRYWAREAETRLQTFDRFTQDQVKILDYAAGNIGFHVTGPAGSGKTMVALEKARSLQKKGKSTALVCYSIGLARLLVKITREWPVAEQPSFVGAFEHLGELIGVKSPDNAGDDWWNTELAAKMIDEVKQDDRRPNPSLPRFDAFVIDEAQDFNRSWWEAINELWRADDSGFPLFTFGDKSQTIFPRDGYEFNNMVPLTLPHNVRNAKPIAELVEKLFAPPGENIGLEGQPIRFVAESQDSAINTADDLVGLLQDEEGWQPSDIVLLTTEKRHPAEDVVVSARGRDGYWDSLWEQDDIFYSTVSKFKGLERAVAIVVLNGWRYPEFAREALYVALSRARELLIVVGDLEEIRQVGGDKVADLLAAHAWQPPVDDDIESTDEPY